jgi:hypothetical protein
VLCAVCCVLLVDDGQVELQAEKQTWWPLWVDLVATLGRLGVCCVLCVVCFVLCVVCCVICAVFCVLCVVCGVLCV